MMTLNNLNYFPLDVESNIYGMTTLKFDDESTKVLVATTNCQIYCISYNKDQAHTKEVQFTYIPHGARIISIGALKRGPNDFVIGITLSVGSSVQKASTTRANSGAGRESIDITNKPTTYYFNIYASGTPFDLDYSAQGCQTIRLPFVPYHLYHTETISYCQSERAIRKRPLWLLSGGDDRIHAFFEDQPYQSYFEVDIEDHFRELTNFKGLALWIDVLYVRQSDNLYQRAVALGLENGSVKLYISVITIGDRAESELVNESSFDAYTTIIPSVRLFKLRSTKPCKIRHHLQSKGLLNEVKNDKLDQVNLFVVSSTESSLIFRDVINSGLDLKEELPESKRLDCAVASAIGDINSDGQNELFIGTHGRELLTYSYDSENDCYSLDSLMELNHSIFAISILDLTGDALREMTILLASGIIIMQASIKNAVDVCRRRVEAILEMLDK